MIHSTWINLECILLSAGRQTWNGTHNVVHVYDILEKVKFWGQKTDQWWPSRILWNKQTQSQRKLFWTPPSTLRHCQDHPDCHRNFYYNSYMHFFMTSPSVILPQMSPLLSCHPVYWAALRTHLSQPCSAASPKIRLSSVSIQFHESSCQDPAVGPRAAGEERAVNVSAKEPWNQELEKVERSQVHRKIQYLTCFVLYNVSSWRLSRISPAPFMNDTRMSHECTKADKVFLFTCSLPLWIHSPRGWTSFIEPWRRCLFLPWNGYRFWIYCVSCVSSLIDWGWTAERQHY